MSNDILGIVIICAIFLITGFFIGHGVGYNSGRKAVYTEAVKVGYGEMVVERKFNQDVMVFKWKVPE